MNGLVLFMSLRTIVFSDTVWMKARKFVVQTRRIREIQREECDSSRLLALGNPTKPCLNFAQLFDQFGVRVSYICSRNPLASAFPKPWSSSLCFTSGGAEPGSVGRTSQTQPMNGNPYGSSKRAPGGAADTRWSYSPDHALSYSGGGPTKSVVNTFQERIA